MLSTILASFGLFTGGGPSGPSGPSMRAHHREGQPTTTTAVNCDDTSKFQLETVRIIPDPVIAGQYITVNVAFLNNYDIIDSGIQRMKVKFNGMPFAVPDEDLCSYNAELCPIQLGYNALNHTFNAPTVPGNVDMSIGWFSPSGENLLCVREQFTIASASASSTSDKNKSKQATRRQY